MEFSLDSIENQDGKIAIVTGANTGLGFETALALAKKNVQVILACRNLNKANTAKSKIEKEYSTAAIDVLQIDLSSLASVRQFAHDFKANYNRLDFLINNAGVMIPPYSQTEDGFELQMGANYFGHFLLTGLLLNSLEKTKDSRIISLASIAHKTGKIHFDNIHWEKNYSKMEAYRQSKLACLMYSFALQEKLHKANYQTISLAAHPGVSNTELARYIPKIAQTLATPFLSFFTHPPKEGALPTVMAALHPEAKGGDYYGPVGYKEMKGRPGIARVSRQAKDKVAQEKLWALSEELTGIKYKFG